MLVATMIQFQRFYYYLAIFIPMVWCHSAVGKNVFKDQRPNFATPESYGDTQLRRFRGDSFDAIFVDAKTRKYYVGGKNVFYVFDMNDRLGDAINDARTYIWPASHVAIERCTMKGTRKREWCQNYVRVLLRNDVTGRLLACGTNAGAPLCRYFENDTLADYEEESGVKKCPFLPAQKSTALYADGQLFTATVAEITTRDSLFSKTDHGRLNIQSPRFRSKWLKIPEFIASFEIDDWIVFFFRENAIELGPSDATVYSRVAKVCKNDIGGEWILENKWTTFQKARINCSFPGPLPFYFNYLQDVYAIDDGGEENVTFFGVFTTGEHEIPGSAVCAFHLSTIREIFERGQFKGQNARSWYAVPRDDVPAPRPGACVNDSTWQPDRTLSFINDHPLMDSSVPNDDHLYPLFYTTRADFRLMQIVVHKIRNVTAMYLGSDDGRILKVALFKDDRGKARSNFLEEIYVGPRDKSESVLNIEIIVNHVNESVLLVNTNTTVVEVPLERCQDLSPCACRQDPYCRASNNTGTNTTCSKTTETSTFHPPDVDQDAQACPRIEKTSADTHSSVICSSSRGVQNNSPVETSTSIDNGDLVLQARDVQNFSSQSIDSIRCDNSAHRSQNIPLLFYVMLAGGWIAWFIAIAVNVVILLYKKISRVKANDSKQNIHLPTKEAGTKINRSCSSSSDRSNDLV